MDTVHSWFLLCCCVCYCICVYARMYCHSMNLSILSVCVCMQICGSLVCIYARTYIQTCTLLQAQASIICFTILQSKVHHPRWQRMIAIAYGISDIVPSTPCETKLLVCSTQYTYKVCVQRDFLVLLHFNAECAILEKSNADDTWHG